MGRGSCRPGPVLALGVRAVHLGDKVISALSVVSKGLAQSSCRHRGGGGRLYWGVLASGGPEVGLREDAKDRSVLESPLLTPHVVLSGRPGRGWLDLPLEGVGFGVILYEMGGYQLWAKRSPWVGSRFPAPHRPGGQQPLLCSRSLG